MGEAPTWLLPLRRGGLDSVSSGRQDTSISVIKWCRSKGDWPPVAQKNSSGKVFSVSIHRLGERVALVGGGGTDHSLQGGKDFVHSGDIVSHCAVPVNGLAHDAITPSLTSYTNPLRC